MRWCCDSYQNAKCLLLLSSEGCMTWAKARGDTEMTSTKFWDYWTLNWTPSSPIVRKFMQPPLLCLLLGDPPPPTQRGRHISIPLSRVILHCKRHKGGNDSKDPQMRRSLIKETLQQMLSMGRGRLKTRAKRLFRINVETFGYFFQFFRHLCAFASSYRVDPWTHD